MKLVSAVVAAAVRTVVVVALYAGFVVTLDASDSDDALGAGLLFFLLVVVLAAVWGVVDGRRRGLAPAALVWLLTGLLSGLGIPVASVAMDAGTGSVADEVRDGALFLGLLVAVPALVGVAVGGLARRVRSQRR